jgi:tetratricopeptide (TPR) repeat protein
MSYQPGDLSSYRLASALGSLAFNLVLNSQFAEAQARCEEAQRLANEIGDGVQRSERHDLIFIQGNLAHALLFQGHYDEALAIYRQYWDKPLHGKSRVSNRTGLDYGRQTECWTEALEPVVRFWLGDQWLLFPFFSFLGGSDMPEEESVSLHFTTGTVLITGPKAGEFCSAFCNHKATLLKADGKDILSVTFQKCEN